MNLISNKKFINLSIILLLPIFFSLIINLIFRVNLHHDSLLMYLNFKFLYNYFESYNVFPEWIDYSYSGLDASVLYLYDVSKIFFPSIIIGKFLNINSYVIYLFNLSLLNSIFLFGIYKNIKQLKYKHFIFFIISSITLTFTFLHKAFSANLEVFLLFPYIFYYLRKFFINGKVSEFNKILIIILIGYINSIQYFSIFFIYFIGIFFIFFAVFNLKFFFKIKFKKKYLIIFVSWILISFFYFFNIETIIQENYLLPNRSVDLNVDNSFSFALHGYHNILIKFLTSLSNFFWWDVPLTISLIGIFFNSIFFFANKNLESKKLRTTIFTFVLFIIILSETVIFYDLVKLFYNLPFLGFFRHFSFIIIYLKPLLLITGLLGLINYFKLIEKKDFNYLFKFKLKFIFYICFSFFFVFILTILINNQLNFIVNGQNEEIFFKNFFSYFNEKLSYLGINNRLVEIDLFRGLRDKILVSFLINFISLLLIFSFIFILIKLNKLNNTILTFLLIINLIPGFYYNYSNYSMSDNINSYSKNKFLIKKINSQYRQIVISDKNFNTINSTKECNDNIKLSLFENFSSIIPKFSIFYENIYLFSDIKNCEPKFRLDFLSKNYKKNKINYLHFDDSIQYEKINNEKFIIYKPKNNIYSNINYSKNWKATNNKNNYLIINNNGKIKIKVDELSNISKIELIYNNNLVKMLAYFSCIIGFFLYLIFFISLWNSFFLINRLKNTK